MIYAKRGTANSKSPEYWATYMRQWRKRNPEKAKAISDRAYLKHKARYIARAKGWSKAHPHLVLAGTIKRRIQRIYGLTPEQFYELWERQNKACAICKKALVLGKYALSGTDLHIDHDHRLRKTRGLLCRLCNIRLGLIEDSAWVVEARRYLNEHGSIIL